jgi:hypothetical protein
MLWARKRLLSSGIRQLDDDLWTVESPLRTFGLRVGARMTVVRLPDGTLLLHSPVALDDACRNELAALGSVRHVVAPNKVHHLFVAACQRAYPEARCHAAPGLAEKRTELHFDTVLDDRAPDDWAGTLDQQVCHGIPYLNEVAFLHVASRSLLLADLAFNLQWGENLWTRMWMRAMGIHETFAVGRHVKYLVRDREALRGSLETILAWDFDRVVVSHGVVLQHAGHRVMRRAFDWLLEP